MNVATGRGYTPARMAGAVHGLNNLLFAPKYLISRFQLLLGQPFVHQWGKGSMRVRTLIAKEYARSLTGTAVVVGLATVAGGVLVRDDPTDSDFLKIRFGDTRLDLFYGLQQVTRFLAQTGVNVTKVARGEKVDRKDTAYIGKFIRSKLSPASM